MNAYFIRALHVVGKELPLYSAPGVANEIVCLEACQRQLPSEGGVA